MAFKTQRSSCFSLLLRFQLDHITTGATETPPLTPFHLPVRSQRAAAAQSGLPEPLTRRRRRWLSSAGLFFFFFGPTESTPALSGPTERSAASQGETHHITQPPHPPRQEATAGLAEPDTQSFTSPVNEISAFISEEWLYHWL